MPLKFPPSLISRRIASSHFSLSSLHSKYLSLLTQHGIKMVEMFFCFLTMRPIFWTIFTKDVLGSTNTHILAFLVSVPSPIVSQDEMTITSLSFVLSNCARISSLLVPLIPACNSIIWMRLNLDALILGNSFFNTDLNEATNNFSSTKLLTEVSRSVLTSE